MSYGTRAGATSEKCPRCNNRTQKTIYNKSNVLVARCRNCGHSWVIAAKQIK